LSPDGNLLAFSSNESGRFEVYLTPFPGRGAKWQISNEGGGLPRWARNGKQLFYARENQVWVVDVQPGPSLAASKPRLLLERPRYRFCDVSPDGTRFLMVKLEDRIPQPITEMILVQNWFEELKRLVPTRKN
jgi:Tol biopolymer transport system component